MTQQGFAWCVCECVCGAGSSGRDGGCGSYITMETVASSLWTLMLE